MIAIIWNEITTRKMMLFWWTFAFVVLPVMIISLYPSFSDQSASLDAAVADLPETVKALVSDSDDFASPNGYLSSQYFYLLYPILLIVLSINLATSAIAREEEKHTLELVLARPVSRTMFLVSKLLVHWLLLGMVAMIGAVATIISVLLIDMDASSTGILLVSFVGLLIAQLFGAVTNLITAGFSNSRALAVGVSTGLALLAYVVASLARAVDQLDIIARISPFYYYEPTSILNGTVNVTSVLIFTAILFAIYLACVIQFNRRDIY